MASSFCAICDRGYKKARYTVRNPVECGSLVPLWFLWMLEFHLHHGGQIDSKIKSRKRYQATALHRHCRSVAAALLGCELGLAAVFGFHDFFGPNDLQRRSQHVDRGPLEPITAAVAPIEDFNAGDLFLGAQVDQPPGIFFFLSMRNGAFAVILVVVAVVCAS